MDSLRKVNKVNQITTEDPVLPTKLWILLHIATETIKMWMFSYTKHTADQNVGKGGVSSTLEFG